MHLLPPQREVDRCSQFRARSFRIQTHRNRAMACAIALGNAGFATSNRSVGTHGLDLSVGTRPSSDRRPAAALAPEIHCGDAESPSESRGRSLQSPRTPGLPYSPFTTFPPSSAVGLPSCGGSSGQGDGGSRETDMSAMQPPSAALFPSTRANRPRACCLPFHGERELTRRDAAGMFSIENSPRRHRGRMSRAGEHPKAYMA